MYCREHLRAIIIASVLYVSLVSICQAQQLEITVDKRIRLDAAGEADVWIWSLPSGVVYSEVEGTVWIEPETPPGTYRANVKAINVDWESRKLEQRSGFVDFFVGEPETPQPPGPGPGPGPDIPGDEFGDIGRDVYEWARDLGLSQTQAAAANYAQAARRLLGDEQPEFSTIESAVIWLKAANEPLNLGIKWSEWGSQVNSRWKTSGVDDRMSAGRFFRAVAAGLEAVE